MKNKIWHIIGLMSGTSLDGVDLVYVKFTKEQDYTFEILEKEAVNYSELWKNKLQEAFHYSGEKLTKLDVDYGDFLGGLVNNFIAKNKIENIDFIASHGHTIFHQPEKNYTLQIGNGAVIAATTNCKVICDFRVQDVAFGGQGAPLVPIGDKLLFADYDFCLNLGGFANISFEGEEKRIAFDISPVNIVLNHYTRKIGLEYDDKGKLASQGDINKKLLDELNNLSFYKDDKPKSLGYEFVIEVIIPIIEAYNLPLNTILKTFIEHAAFQISKVINQNLSDINQNVLITGGGAFNDYLISRISHYAKAEIIVPDKEIINYKEALIFAFLGLLKNQNEVNCLKSVTGARKDHSSGIVYNV
ncbi:MAG: anhydro-N-acetylmuramic acid kinase [Flavobacteriaceae bacterium]|nr:anhydro-N-acetylmuramic acid kinase [Flavobacteriaceae bacterium]